MKNLYIGTSGYSYQEWKNNFYPPKLGATKWLNYYSTQFNTVELNGTFYRFPVAGNLKKNAAVVGDDFKFSVKAHKIITHSMRMKGVKDKVQEFTDVVLEGLGEKLACILFQLPPSYSFTEERLEDVISNISGNGSNVIEFRHSSWWNKEVFARFKQTGLSFCSVSYPNLPEDNIATANVFYKRMHGVPTIFQSPYSEEALQTLAHSIPNCKEAFIYFNNTMFNEAHKNAAYLKSLLV